MNYRHKSDYSGSIALHCAANKGHTEVCEILLSNSNLNIDAKDNNGFTALHLATLYG